MGWLTPHTKDLIQILYMDKKINNLMKASILYYFLPPPTLIAPRTIKYRSPAFPAGRASSPNPSPSAPSEFSFFLCDIVRQEPRRISVNFFFCPVIQWPKSCESILLDHHFPARRLPRNYPNDTVDFWLVVASPHPAEAIETQAPIALSIFILSSLNSPPKPTSKRPPPHVPPGRISSQTPPLTASTIVRLIVASTQ